MTLDSIPGSSEMSPAELLAYLQQPANSPRPNPVTVATMIATIGRDATRQVLGTIQAAAAVDPILGAVYQALASSGISLHQVDRQSMIDELAVAGSWSPELIAAVKSLGVDPRPRWEVLGFAELPSLESIETEIAARDHAARVIRAVQIFRDRMSIGDDPAAVMSLAWSEAE